MDRNDLLSLLGETPTKDGLALNVVEEVDCGALVTPMGGEQRYLGQPLTGELRCR